MWYDKKWCWLSQGQTNSAPNVSSKSLFSVAKMTAKRKPGVFNLYLHFIRSTTAFSSIHTQIAHKWNVRNSIKAALKCKKCIWKDTLWNVNSLSRLSHCIAHIILCALLPGTKSIQFNQDRKVLKIEENPLLCPALFLPRKYLRISFEWN